MDWIYVALGLVILLLGGDSLVRGAVNLSLRLGVPALIVSLTIVSFGTSAPELLISIGAVTEGVPGLAMGNVIGSNTANVLLVLGVPALLAPMATSCCNTRKSYLITLGATFLFIALCFFGPITWWHALILLGYLAIVLLDNFREAVSHRADAKACNEEEVEGADPNMSWPKIGLFILLGLIGLPLGADLLIDGAENIARTFGVPETVIGLTLVAIGTSLPELATTVMAALRKQADVALGNVIGSNMFNLLAIIGVAGLVGPLPVDPELLRFDLWVMLGATVLLVPFVFFKRDITRGWGIALTAGYVAYILTVLL
ncbi:MAG: calcium/sodium antiporter [Pseudoruegeria sp.]